MLSQIVSLCRPSPHRILKTAFFMLSMVGCANAFAAAAEFSPPEQVASYFSGGYLGLGIGGAQTDARYKTEETITVLADSLSTSSKPDKRKRSALGTIYLGYGYLFNSGFHLAGEIFDSVTSHNTTFKSNGSLVLGSTQGTFGTSLKAKLRNNEYGFDILPGFLYSPNMLIRARLGVAFNKITFKPSSFFNTTAPAATATSLVLKKNKNVTGKRVGIGLENRVADNWSLLGDYVYTHYGKVKTSGTAVTASPLGGSISVEGHSSVRVSTHAVTLGAKYYFST